MRNKLTEYQEINFPQKCKHCEDIYVIQGLKDCCKKCFLHNVKKDFPYQLKWQNRKRLAYIAFFTIVPLLSIGRIFGAEIQLLVTGYFVFGCLHTHLIDWLMKKF